MFRILATFAVLAAVSAQRFPSANDLINDLEHISFLNSIVNTTWESGVNARFENMTFEDVRGLFGTELSHISEHVEEALSEAHYSALIKDEDVPTSFNAVENWKGLVGPIRDQQRCGSCWAFSASEVLGDRFAIASQSADKTLLSPEDMVACDKTDMGCQGGALPNAWKYLQSSGVVTDKCMPYTAGSGTAPSCPTRCADGESISASKHKASKVYPISGVSAMQKEIMTNGPIQVAFKVYKSFMTYKSGVYSKHWWEFMPEGGHAVKIVGWGTESGHDYWLVANSWNTTWGLQGFFKIKRGKDQCGIETMGPPYAGMPAL